MKIYHASFPFEVNPERGGTGFYAPVLRDLRDEIRQIVDAKVSQEPYELRYFTKPLDEPDEKGQVPVEIAVAIEAIQTAPVTRELFCQVVNGEGGFVTSRRPHDTMRFRFMVPADIFEE